MFVLDYLALAIAVFGVLVITWGIAVTAVRWGICELNGLRAGNISRGRERVRHQLGSSLLLGLEFLIAADIIETIRNPGLEEIAVLASIVAIRTVISFFLNRELADSTD